MQTIAFFISNHGFGHIMRNIPVIAWILEHTQHRILLVTGAKHVAAAKDYLERYTDLTDLQERLVCVEQDTDLGLIVKPGTLLVDWDAVRTGLQVYVDEFPKRIREAKALLAQYHADNVVCDIVPWALTAAKEAGVPSCLMASFTWIEQYERDVPEELVQPFRDAYADADHVILYGLHTSTVDKLFPVRHEVSLCARPFHEENVQGIRRKYGKHPIVFVSIGLSNQGIRNGMDVSRLPYSFIVTEGVNLKGENVSVIPKIVDNTQDYVMASDYCIAKAGWTTIAEILLAKKPMALLSRPDVAEDTMYIEQMVHDGIAIELSVEELEHIDKILQRLETMPHKKNMYQEDTERIGRIICEISKADYAL